MKLFYPLLLLVFTLGLVACSESTSQELPAYDQGINVIPLPLEISEGDGQFEFGKNSKILIADTKIEPIAQFFAEKLRRSTGYKLPIETASEAASKAIFFAIDTAAGFSPEGYELHATSKQIKLSASTEQGLFYAMQTLLQLLPAEVERQSKSELPWLVPAVHIKDQPQFAYRGFMLDVVRHFLPVAELKRHIDMMAMFKINRFHWHLTDDQGWRIEIKKHPLLTEKGSKRIEGDGTEYAAYYTQEEIKEVVAYAAERYITVIPEIEMPGHAMAALTAYPQLACFPRDFKPRIIWGIEDDVYCAGNDEVFALLEDVIAELVPLFPSEYYHIGGDECPKLRWEKCPKCQKRMRDNQLKNEHELQSYFIKRMEGVLANHGKRIIGWEEILEGGLAPTATVMSWKGTESGIASAKMKHQVVMSPASEGLYINFYQGDPALEPVAIGGNARLEKIYSYNPIAKELSADEAKYIIGVQCNLWAEYLYSSKLYEYHAYPSLLALAEVAWTPYEKKDFNDFCRRLENAAIRLEAHEIDYHIPQPEQPEGSSNFIAFVDTVSVAFTSSRPIKMLYTLDGSEPNAQSAIYSEPLQFDKSSTLKIRSQMLGGRMSPVRSISIEKQELSPALDLPSKLNPGLMTRTTYGLFQEVPDLSKATAWTLGKIASFKELRGESILHSLDEVRPKAVEATGYLLIPEDGVYDFASNNNEFWIDNVKLIDNAGEVKKYSRKNSSRALKAGYHRIKTIWIGNVQGGWPSYWSSGAVYIRPSRSGADFKPMAAEQLFH